MRSSLKLLLWLATGAAAVANLPEWVRHIESGGAIEEIFFAEQPMPAGPVDVRRSPAQTRPLLDQAIAADQERAQLYALRAREAERALDFTAAEADWRAFAERVDDPAEGQLALADFFERRLRPAEAVEALSAVGRAPDSRQDSLRIADQRRSWKAFERAVRLADEHALAPDVRLGALAAWLTRFPENALLHERRFAALLEAEEFAGAEQAIADYEAQFAGATSAVLAWRARLSAARDGADQALALYEASFDPLWPTEVFQSYFDLLEEAQRLAERRDEARAGRATAPLEIEHAAWLFHYARRLSDRLSAVAALDSYLRQERTEPWTARELEVLARLFLLENAANDAARCWHGLYSLGSATAQQRETALAELASLLLSRPEQPIELGSEDLSLYRDVATADQGPGFLNGALSLLLNEQGLDWQFRNQDAASRAYFRRGKGVELLERLDAEFPESERAAALHAQVVEAFAVYGDSEAVLTRGQAFLDRFAESDARGRISLRMAEAHARLGDEEAELAAYDRLLAELAEAAQNAPLGPGVVTNSFGRRSYGPAAQPRSPEYARVLDRAVARRVALGRPADAVRLLFNEITRNPDDPGLYERLASFLQSNGMADRVEGVYRSAMNQFEDRSWHHKLARWYLRRQRAVEFEALTREVTGIFSGSELEAYFTQVVSGGIDVRAYLALNRLAHDRFPHNLTFVRNLLRAYQTRGTANPAEWERLLRRHWHESDDLRRRFFAFLKRSGKLDQELAQLEAANPAAAQENWSAAARQNPAAVQFWAEGKTWKRHFEEAAPALLALATEAPLDEPVAERAWAVHRSLAYESALAGDVAAALADAAASARPGNRQVLARVGDTLADRALFDRAAPYWDRMARTAPGKPEAWVDAATVYWDYYQFDDAVRMLDEGRRALERPELFAYERGAIAEARDDRAAAVRDYLSGALAEETNYRARNRLSTLSRREGYRDVVEQATAALTASAEPAAKAVELRVDVLAAQQRFDEVGELLGQLAARTESRALLDRVDQLATNRNLTEVREVALQRRIELTSDPVERISRRLELAQWYEAQERDAEAEQVAAAVYREHPLLLGVVRNRVDQLWRADHDPRAVEVLLTAAGAAHADLAEKFRLEAARKSIEIERFPEAREVLDALLAERPFEPTWLAAKADSYAAEGLDGELVAFYQRTLDAIDEARPANRRTLTAQLRRGLIPALSRLGEHAAAVDQYVELINRFPEDRALVEEAGLYAADHNAAERLESFYLRTTEDSPRDVRYHRVLAWLRTTLEDPEGAAAAYARALEVRPDSTDLWAAKASLDERLLRFADAREAYQKLYELDYEAPEWIERVGLNALRQGDQEAALEALRLARLEGRPEKPENYFAAAGVAADWGLLEQAYEWSAEAARLAGEDLFWSFSSETQKFFEVAVRLRRHEDAYRLARGLWKRPVAELPFYVWQDSFRALLEAAGVYLGPDEQVVFRAFLNDVRAPLLSDEYRQAQLPAIQTAGPAEVEIAWLRESLLRQAGSGFAASDRRRLEYLQRRRMQHGELIETLEAHYDAHPDQPRHRVILATAAHAALDAGDDDEALRLYERYGVAATDERYLDLLLRRDPDRLVTLAAGGDHGEAAANFAVLQGDAALARRVVTAHARGKAPVWRQAYMASAGLFHRDDSPLIAQAYDAAVAGGPVASRIGQSVDRTEQLAGDLWFAYAADFGTYLDLTQALAAADYLPAELELRPANAPAYSTLAEQALEAGRLADARADFEHVLELRADDPTALEGLGEAAWAADDRAEAATYWRRALEAWTAQLEERRFEPSLWERAPDLIARASERGADLADAPGALLTAYVRVQGPYRFEAFARAAGLERAVERAGDAPDPVGFLRALEGYSWLSDAQRERLLRQALRTAAERAASAPAPLRPIREQERRTIEVELLGFLLDRGRTGDAEALGVDRERLRNEQPVLALRWAAQAGVLDELLADGDFPDYVFREAASDLRRSGRDAAARRLMEAAYEHAIARRELSAANLLGLAEIRLEQGRAEDAEALVDRLLRTSTEPFAHHLASADLLRRFGRDAKAREIVEARIQAAPWDADARFRLDPSALRTDTTAPARLRFPEPTATPSTEAALSAALSQDPENVDARTALFLLLAADGRDALAVEAFRPLADGTNLAYPLASRESVYDDREPYANVEPLVSREFLSTAKLDDERRIELLAALTAALERQGRLQAAQTAAELRAGLDGERSDLERILAKRRVHVENLKRRPVIRKELDLRHDVRPKLTAAAGGAR